MFPWTRPSSPLLEQYQRYRAATKPFSEKIMKAALALGLGQNNHLVLDSQDDIGVLADFTFYEVIQHGKSLVQKYQDEYSPSNEVERGLLAAMVKAQTGLFRVESVSKRTAQLHMRSLIGDPSTLSLTDISLSQSARQGLIVFFRPLVLSDFSMTSGMAFVFAPELEQNLIKQWTKRSSAERYAKYFKLSKSSGIPTIFT